MKKKLFLAGLLVAWISPAVQAAGVNLGSGAFPVQMDIPSLIAPLNSSGGFLGRPNFHPRSLHINGDIKFGPRIESRVRCAWDNRKRPSVPEAEGIAAAFAAGILGLGYAGYTFGQRRRVHGAA